MIGFLPAISPKAAKRIREEINSWPWLRWVQGEVREIIRHSQSKLRGWMEYYGKFGLGRIKHVLFHFDQKLTRWAMRKYKSLKTRWQAVKRVMAFKSRNPRLMPHW